MIDLLGDRLNSGFCLKCGALLMMPWNDYQMCGTCTGETERALAAFYKKRKLYKKVGSGRVHRGQIHKQMMPIGVPVK